MMRLFMYTVYDSAAKMFDRPIAARSDGEMSRVFQDLCVRDGHHFAEHPGDYTLFKIGEYDDNSGEITPMVIERMANGLEMVKAAQAVGTEEGEVDAA